MFPPGGEGAGFLALCPPAGTEDVQLVARHPDGTDVGPSAEGVRKVVGERTHLAPGAVTEVRWTADFRPRAAPADRFRVGRVFLMSRFDKSRPVESPAELGQRQSVRAVRRRCRSEPPPEYLHAVPRQCTGEQVGGFAQRELGLQYSRGILLFRGHSA
ncbi:hypothetical protein [Streptomyces antibioticus]|uniref:hypothetical protein n=1 Tax=Streptomyces antibioticus TaxID=1890 RepID=UPI003D747DC5